MRIRLYGDVSHETYCRAFLYVVMSADDGFNYKYYSTTDYKYIVL